MKKIISLGVLFIGALSFTQERIDGQSAVQAQFGYIPSTGDFSDGKIIRLEYDRVMDNKGWLGKAGIFYKDYEVGYTHNQILPYKKIGINVVAGYTYEGLQPVFLNAYLGVYGGYEIINEGKTTDPLYNAKIPKPVKGFTYGLTGSAELEVIIIRNFSFVADYTQFYDLKSSFSKWQGGLFGGFKYYIN